MNRELPEGFAIGPVSAQDTIGEVTESIHRFLLDNWNLDRPPPRIEEDLSFVPKDREEVVYVYMYRAVENTNLKNAKRFRQLPFSVFDEDNPDESVVYYEMPPLYLDLHYLIAVHSKFRSDAERLLGWVLMTLHHATHLLYRPRRYLLPDGRTVDTTGAIWSPDNRGEDVVMEKVALALVDDLTVGDAINFFTIHEAPFRPYITYQARCNVRGSVITGSATTVSAPRSDRFDPGGAPLGDQDSDVSSGEQPERPVSKSGRFRRMPPTKSQKKPSVGPAGHGVRPVKGNSDNEG